MSKLNHSKSKGGTSRSAKPRTPDGDSSLKGVSRRMKGKRCKRAWKLRAPRIQMTDNELATCQYCSRRTGVSCDNVRPLSQLSSVGICEQHIQFARQLKELSKAEQNRSDRIGATVPARDHDGFINVIDEDETLTTTSNWPWSEESINYDTGSSNAILDSIANTGVMSDKEVLKFRLAALESKMKAIEEFDEILDLKQLRFDELLSDEIKKKVNKDDLIAVSREEKRLMRELRACKSYDGWLNSKSAKCLQNKVECRLKSQQEGVNSLDYLDVRSALDNCSFVYQEECGDELEQKPEAEAPKSGEEPPNAGESETTRKKVIRRPCANSAMPKMNFCLEHVFENDDQQLFAACLECGAPAVDCDDGENYCSAHISKKAKCRNRSSFDSTTTPPSSMRTSVEGSAASLSYPFLNQKMMAKEEHAMDTAESQAEKFGLQFTGLDLNLGDLDLRGSGSEVLYEGDDGGEEAPVKFVLIDSEGEDTDEQPSCVTRPDDSFSRPNTTDSRQHKKRQAPSILQRMPSSDFPPNTNNAGVLASRRNSVPSRSRKLDEKYPASAARTRPFIPAFFSETAAKQKSKKTLQRYITIEQRTRMEEAQNSVQGGIPKMRPAIAYTQPGMQPHRTPSVAENFPKTTPVVARPGSSTNLSHGTTPTTRLTDPSSISLGSAPALPAQPPSNNPRPVVPRTTNQPALSRNRQIFAQQLVRQSASPAIAVEQRSMYGTSSGSQWRVPPGSAPIVTSRPLSNYSKPASSIEFNDRMLSNQRSMYSSGDYRRPRDEGMFPVAGSARSRLVPVDPPPTVYYPQQRYRSFIVPRGRTYSREHAMSVRHLTVPRDAAQERQQSSETAAAVASIAALGDPQADADDEQQPQTTTTSQPDASSSANQPVKYASGSTIQPMRSGSVDTQTVGDMTCLQPSRPVLQNPAEITLGGGTPVERTDSQQYSTAKGGDCANTNTVTPSQRCVPDSVEDGLALLAATAASQAAAVHPQPSGQEKETIKGDVKVAPPYLKKIISDPVIPATHPVEPMTAPPVPAYPAILTKRVTRPVTPAMRTTLGRVPVSAPRFIVVPMSKSVGDVLKSFEASTSVASSVLTQIAVTSASALAGPSVPNLATPVTLTMLHNPGGSGSMMTIMAVPTPPAPALVSSGTTKPTPVISNVSESKSASYATPESEPAVSGASVSTPVTAGSLVPKPDASATSASTPVTLAASSSTSVTNAPSVPTLVTHAAFESTTITSCAPAPKPITPADAPPEPVSVTASTTTPVICVSSTYASVHPAASDPAPVTPPASVHITPPFAAPLPKPNTLDAPAPKPPNTLDAPDPKPNTLDVPAPKPNSLDVPAPKPVTPISQTHKLASPAVMVPQPVTPAASSPKPVSIAARAMTSVTPAALASELVNPTVPLPKTAPSAGITPTQVNIATAVTAPVTPAIQVPKLATPVSAPEPTTPTTKWTTRAASALKSDTPATPASIAAPATETVTPADKTPKSAITAVPALKSDIPTAPALTPVSIAASVPKPATFVAKSHKRKARASPEPSTVTPSASAPKQATHVARSYKRKALATPEPSTVTPSASAPKPATFVAKSHKRKARASPEPSTVTPSASAPKQATPVARSHKRKARVSLEPSTVTPSASAPKRFTRSSLAGRSVAAVSASPKSGSPVTSVPESSPSPAPSKSVELARSATASTSSSSLAEKLPAKNPTEVLMSVRPNMLDYGLEESDSD